MNGRMIVAVLAVVAVLAGLSFAQEAEQRREGRGENPQFQLEMRQRQLELEAREVELGFQRQMRELDLEERRVEIERAREKHGRHGPEGVGKAGPLLALCVIVNILLTVWVYQDIRKRNAGSGLWIVVTLLAGFLGALLYVLVRLGDVKQEHS